MWRCERLLCLHRREIMCFSFDIYRVRRSIQSLGQNAPRCLCRVLVLVMAVVLDDKGARLSVKCAATTTRIHIMYLQTLPCKMCLLVVSVCVWLLCGRPTNRSAKRNKIKHMCARMFSFALARARDWRRVYNCVPYSLYIMCRRMCFAVR